VDPTRLELVTSAMRGRREGFADVRYRSEMRLNKPNPRTFPPRMFAAVRTGCRQTVVNQREILRALSISASAPVGNRTRIRNTTSLFSRRLVLGGSAWRLPNRTLRGRPPKRRAAEGGGGHRPVGVLPSPGEYERHEEASRSLPACYSEHWIAAFAGMT
jgi:hypothetical protein